jgi:hypothetical protein
MINVQKGLFGDDKYIADTREKLMELCGNNPEIAENKKLLLVEFWRAYEGLAEVLGDKIDSFISWFGRCTSPETLTRCLRSLKEDGTIKLAPDKVEQRQEQEQDWRLYWGNQSRERRQNG